MTLALPCRELSLAIAVSFFRASGYRLRMAAWIDLVDMRVTLSPPAANQRYRQARELGDLTKSSSRRVLPDHRLRLAINIGLTMYEPFFVSTPMFSVFLMLSRLMNAG